MNEYSIALDTRSASVAGTEETGSVYQTSNCVLHFKLRLAARTAPCASTMCGRGAATAGPAAVRQALDLPADTRVRRPERAGPSTNLHPGQYAPIAAHPKSSQAAEIIPMRWGLVPSFTKPT
jgi:SOS response associated peptidase (SRAP)